MELARKVSKSTGGKWKDERVDRSVAGNGQKTNSSRVWGKEEFREAKASEIGEFVEGLKGDVEELIDGLDKLEASLGTTLSEVIERIYAREKDLKAEIEARRKELLDCVQRIREHKIKSWTEKRRECDVILRMLSGCTVNGRGVTQKLVTKLEWFTGRLTRLCHGIEDGDVHFVEDQNMGHIRLSPCPDMTTADVKRFAFSNMINSFTVTVKDPLGRVIREGNQVVTVTVTDGTRQAVYSYAEDLQTGCHKVSFYPDKVGKLVLDVHLNAVPISDMPKEVIVREGSPVRAPILVLGKGDEEDEKLSRPWGVCCDKAGRILVTDRHLHTIQVFSKNGYLFNFGEPGNGPGQFKCPAGIAVDKFGRIIVADKDNHRVQIFDSSGVYISRFVGNCLVEEERLDYPWDVAVTESCEIAVTETSKNRVSLFTDTGILLRRFVFGPEANCKAPRGIACRPNGSFLVTDFNAHQLVILDAKLEKADVYGGPGSRPAEFRRPQGVSVWGDNMFAVSDGKNNRIQIFRNGVVYEAMGKLGTAEGEFNSPQGLAFHPDGSLVVVDMENLRLQIFEILK